MWLGLFRLWCAAILAGLAGAQAALASESILQVTADGTSSVRPAWSPDGSRIAFQTSVSNAYRVYTMAADGSDRQQITQDQADDRHPAWSRDGSMLAVDTGTDTRREIALVDLAKGTRTQITNLGGFASFPSWSPDGSRLSFYVYQHGALDLWTINRDGTGARQLTQTLASENKSQCTFACHAAAFSPDGSRLAYADGDQRNVYTMRSDDGTDQVKASADDLTGRSHFPSYLSDGRLSYVTEHVDPGQSWTDIWAVMPGSNQPPAALVQNVQAQGPFEFSPDLQKLLFASPRNGNFDIYVVTLDAAGKDALAQRSSETAMSRGVSAPPMPPGVSTAPMSIAQPAAESAPQAGLSFSPYLIALGGLALVWTVLEGAIILRRRRRSGPRGQ